jgi:3-oxoacyl-[acyl-carrier-protein] synthase-1
LRISKIYAEIVGYGATSDGADMVAPSGEGAVRCMRQALKSMQRYESDTEQGVCEALVGKNPIVQPLPGCIDYINTHGTSTPVGDDKEIEAIREVFGKNIPWLSSTKSLTGHSLGAAGVQEAIYSIIMMQERFLCESAHIEELDPAFEDMPIIRTRIDDAKVDTVMSNSFGFGGTNATLIFSRYVP